MQSVSPRAPEPARAPHARLQLLHFHHLGRVDPLDDKLRDPVPLLHLKVCVVVVEEKHFNGTPVVGVDDARARVDEVLGGETGAWGDAAVYLSYSLSVFLCVAEMTKADGLTRPRRNGHADIRVDQRLAPSRNGCVARGVQVIARCKCAAAGRQACLV